MTINLLAFYHDFFHYYFCIATYGAQKYQWCPTNDTACDDDESKSPAQSSCLNDTTAGNREWKTRTLTSLEEYTPYYEHLKTRNEEIPFGESDYYWTGGYSSSDSSYALAQLLIEGSDTKYFLKNTSLHVVCIDR